MMLLACKSKINVNMSENDGIRNTYLKNQIFKNTDLIKQMQKHFKDNLDAFTAQKIASALLESL